MSITETVVQLVQRLKNHWPVDYHRIELGLQAKDQGLQKFELYYYLDEYNELYINLTLIAVSWMVPRYKVAL